MTLFLCVPQPSRLDFLGRMVQFLYFVSCLFSFFFSKKRQSELISNTAYKQILIFAIRGRLNLLNIVNFIKFGCMISTSVYNSCDE